ncbi:hypothetical protein LX16_4421 [Stackebrandtia albiflava]|uniref:Phage resistance protein n=1 Tax=Stackebrandtia albiflava TaxID=406432 RepID=A0A562URF7_9ACTN|nr:phage resistance protein [Stackebrandtia albiflava]TWJ08200.1 hypothetical protein LX16_4421 [Stackebrandtia albiflava]
MTRTLDDIFDIPESVQAGDWVMVLGRDTMDDVDKLLAEYVVTDQLAECFDEALTLVRTAVTTGVSQAAYLEGSFGAGKSHFLGVLKAILQHHPNARGKHGLTKTIATHDAWLPGKRFLQITQHMIDAQSLEDAILGRYVDTVREHHPGKPLPVVYQSDTLIADAKALRRRIGDDAFIGGLFEAESDGTSSDSIHDAWDESGWDTDRLDEAFAAAPESSERQELVSALIGRGAHFASYHDSFRGSGRGFIDLDTGLARISAHAKDVLGYDAVVLHLDETVLWLSQFTGDIVRMNAETQKLSKLVESAETHRPAPIISFLPRQRDLIDILNKGVSGREVQSVSDQAEYGAGRFQPIKLSDENLPTVVQERLLRPKSPDAADALDAAFDQTANSRTDIWDTLLDAQGETGTAAQFRKSYPFSPAFLHVMVNVSSALQRTRSALKLMSEMLGAHRELPLGKLMPVGAIFQALCDSAERPFPGRLRDEFDKTKQFYHQRLRPFLARRHNLSDADIVDGKTTAGYDADDLIVKTLLLSALVTIPALQELTASRLHALNLGAVTARVPGTEVRTVAQTLRDLGAEFGDFHVTQDPDPRVDVNLIGVDTHRIIQLAGPQYDSPEDRQRKLRQLLWAELGLTDDGTPTAVKTIVWRGTERTVEVVYGNVREQATATFHPDRPGAIKVLIDYPFDTGNFGPSDDRGKVANVAAEVDEPPLTFAWLPSFFQHDRLQELGQLVIIDALLSQDRLAELTGNLTSDERVHARGQLESRRSNLTSRIVGVLKQAYGVAGVVPIDVEAHDVDHFCAVDRQLELAKPSAGQPLREAFTRACHQLLAHNYPTHPDLDADGTGKPVRIGDLNKVLSAVERAAQLPDRRLELEISEKSVLRRIANPLEIATVGEVFVLRQDWQLRLDRLAAAAGATGDLSVRRLRGWVDEEVPGLPPLVVDLLVHVYANLADRSWLMAGQPIDPQALGKMHADAVLRKPELPPRDAFESASTRATDIFGAERRVAYTSRSTQALFRHVRESAQQALSGMDALRSDLEERARVLGLSPESARLSTVKELWTVLSDLVSHTTATPLLQELADATLPKDAGVYKNALETARGVREALLRTHWNILDSLVGLAEGGSEQSRSAASILEQLRKVAREDELTQRLAPALDEAVGQASALFAAAVNRPTPPQPDLPPDPPVGATRAASTTAEETTVTMPPPPHINAVTKQVTGRDAAGIVAELTATLRADPDARFEITWRKMD